MASPRFNTGHRNTRQDSCFGCRGCGQLSSQVPLQLSPRRQFMLLTNTLLLPLLGFVGGSLVANYSYAHEMSQVAGAIIGFAIGMLCCRSVSLITDEVVDYA